MDFPVDFEKKVRLPAQAGNGGYPYRISARDLMLNFRFAALEVGESEVDGIELVEDRSDSKRRLRITGSAAKSLPFSVSVTAAGLVSVRPGFYQIGATGEWIDVDPPSDQDGSHVYAIIDMTGDDLDATLTIEIRGSAYDESVVLSETAPYPATQARVLLATITNGVVTQYKHGNFTLGLWQVDGSVTRWPETTAGTPT